MGPKILLLTVLCVYCFVYIECDTKYDTKFDNVDVDAILNNNRLRKNYVKCLVNEGPCTPGVNFTFCFKLKSGISNRVTN